MPRGARYLVLIPLAWLAGCQALPFPAATGPRDRAPPPVVRSGAPAGAEQVTQLLLDAATLEHLSAAELAARRGNAERELERSDTPANRLQLALLLARSGETGERARALLAPLAAEDTEADPPLAALASWLLADWQRERRRREQLRNTLAEHQARIETLERQLQEIRSIEQQLERRNRRSAGDAYR